MDGLACHVVFYLLLGVVHAVQLVFDLHGGRGYFLGEEVGKELPDYVDVGIGLC